MGEKSIKPELTYETLNHFLSKFKPTSIAWRLRISKEGIETMDKGVIAWCHADKTSITQTGLEFQKA
jgi:hypothetical protein